MEDWRTLYKQKKTDLKSAVEKSVRSGDQVVLGHCSGVPVELTNEMKNQAGRLKNVRVFHMVPLHDCWYCDAEWEGRFKHSTVFAGGATRGCINEGRGDFIPCFFSELPGRFRDGSIDSDVAFIMVSPPDEHGFMSYGISVDYTLQAAETARVVVAEVNSKMPKTYGSYIHVSEVDYLVETDYEPIEIPLPKIGEVERKIGQYIAELIPDRATLQLGIGAIPDAVLHFLTEKKDLGIHTEMFSDGVVDLYEQGVVTNKYNNLNPGKFVATFLMGTKRLYDFANDNPAVMMKPVDYTNNILVAGRLENLISINSALEVDLYGQVCADMIGGKQFTAVGGQVDFVRAAMSSKGGKSIIAFPSTGKKGAVSRITARLKEGACVTTSRHDVDYIVTEYGVAHLKGKSNSERAEALINIAHPDFREELRKSL
ncbi:MAG: acetyl-CoA hydrolase/transferase C-terminal domain-containing protein [Spirochaetales bacterium]|uniref:Acetyl-CoA hydrolase/transferase C-terminal domain-containing protein n=1 Tax=Candidatus Thalassospirochaeta sargassi TaxID=3119039 RepID=A0AAJ1ICV3_9SPIO|nr:acetyl-CoA hydrolase/transferase C-terminal domain-containing protein [Spirochaetales bacterium]